MADLTRKTANLFDKDNTTIYNAYFSIDSESSIWINNADSRSVKIPCRPNTQYTLSISSAIPIFRICSSSNANVEPTGGGVRVRTIIRSGNIQQYTFTTSADDACILFQGSVSLVNEWFNSLMLNEGSTALPYEPYGWVHSLRKLTTATEAVENPLYSDGTAITAYTLKGNEEHTGTPSPQNPVMPNGVGNKTANLLNQDESTQGDGYIANTILKENDTTATSNSFFVTEYIPVTGGATYYYYTRLYRSSTSYIVFYDSSKNYISEVLHKRVMEDEEFNLTSIAIPSNASYLRMCIDKQSTQNCLYSSVLPSYIPYGYKIPISSGSTTPIYLGSVASNRQIDKIVFDGTESFLKDSDLGNSARYYIDVAGMKSYTTDLLSTHYTQSDTYEVNTIRTYQRLLYFSVDKTVYATVTDFQTFLQQQYAAGTPVTVWFVLGTARTATVNEPLMKIGDYSDSIANAVSIPTTDGANTITVDTTVQPSEFTATWTGWHDSSVKEYDGSDWQ